MYEKEGVGGIGPGGCRRLVMRGWLSEVKYTPLKVIEGHGTSKPEAGSHIKPSKTQQLLENLIWIGRSKDILRSQLA